MAEQVNPIEKPQLAVISYNFKTEDGLEEWIADSIMLPAIMLVGIYMDGEGPKLVRDMVLKPLRWESRHPTNRRRVGDLSKVNLIEDYAKSYINIGLGFFKRH